MAWTIALSAGLHLLVLALVLYPPLQPLEAQAPPAVDVDVVTPSQMASLESSSAPQSSAAPSSDAASSEPASAAPSALPPPTTSSTAEPPSAPPSRPPPPRASPAKSSSASPTSSEAPSGRAVVPVGPAASVSEEDGSGEASADEASASDSASGAPTETAASSVAADPIASLLAVEGVAKEDVASSTAEAAASASSVEPKSPSEPKPVGGGTLHAAKRFYLKEMLTAPGLAQAKQALKTLSAERRLAQTCNIEAYGQTGHAGYGTDAIIANAFAPPAISGTTYTVTGGAFRSGGNWYRLAYRCALSKDMTSVTSFSFHIGADVTAQMTARLGGG